MATKNSSLSLSLILFLSILALPSPALDVPTPFMASVSRGSWEVLQRSIGISAMHMQLLHDNKIVMYDRTNFGRSNLTLPGGRCRDNPRDLVLKHDCTAHSVLYDVDSNTFRPLMVHTDTWCSSGAVDPSGTLVQTGGYNDGERVIRTFTPCEDGRCDWTELSVNLTNRRWYASNQILPDGRVIVVGGRNVFTYEFFPRARSSPNNFFMNFLKETNDLKEENNLYPFLHLLPDGNLFVFANTRAISFDYTRNRIVREFPAIPGLDKRNYPSTGSSVMLPLWLAGGNSTRIPDTEVLVCGGAPTGSFPKTRENIFLPASRTCGRIKVTDPEPEWYMEEMPMPRVISDMILLPTGDVILINGASNGTAGWESARNPVYNPVLYVTYEKDPTLRFVVQNPSSIPRMYHSAAVLLPDGRVLVGGSNPHRFYNFTIQPFPTDLSVEAFSPHYLAPLYVPLRPSIVAVETGGSVITYGQMFSMTFILTINLPDAEIFVSMMAPSFTTHSFAMNQRLLMLKVARVDRLSLFAHKVTVHAPPTNVIAPPGYYMAFIIHAGIPSSGVWVKLQQSR